jgi:hypothetical protein
MRELYRRLSHRSKGQFSLPNREDSDLSRHVAWIPFSFPVMNHVTCTLSHATSLKWAFDIQKYDKRMYFACESGAIEIDSSPAANRQRRQRGNQVLFGIFAFLAAIGFLSSLGAFLSLKHRLVSTHSSTKAINLRCIQYLDRVINVQYVVCYYGSCPSKKNSLWAAYGRLQLYF